MRARLALLRWTVRVVRSEWRQHALVTAMVASGIASAVVIVSAGVRGQAPTERYFHGGDATVTLTLPEELNSDKLFAIAAALLTDFPETEITVANNTTEIDGLDGIQLRGVDPTGPLASTNYDLLDGRWPRPGEIALTEGAVQEIGISTDEVPVMGDAIQAGPTRLIFVGVYEDVTYLSARQAIVPPFEVPAGRSVTALISDETGPALEAWKTSGVSWYSFRSGGPSEQGGDPDAEAITAFVDTRSNSINQSGGGSGLAAYGLGTVLMLQIAILASAGFTVLAARRTRQLGMLSAIGASPRRLASAMRFTGVVVGLIGGMLGLAVGVVLAAATTPLVQKAVDQRLSPFDLPWLWLLPMIPLAVLTSLLAAWWPSRRVREISVVDAIASRRSPQGRVGWMAPVAVVLLGAGGFGMTQGARREDAVVIIISIIALTVGALTMVGPVISVASRLARLGPLSMRVALRDLDRNRARSIGSVAAAAITLGLAFGISSFAGSMSHNYIPNVPDNIVTLSAEPFDQETYEIIRTLESGQDFFAPVDNRIEGATLAALEVPIDRAATDEFAAQSDGAPSTEYYVQEVRKGARTGLLTAIATPELLALMEISPSPGVDVVVTVENPIEVPGLADAVVERHPKRSEFFPDAVIISDRIPTVDPTDVEALRWYLSKDAPFTSVERDQLASAAVSTQVLVESQQNKPPFVLLRTAVLAGGALMALGIIAIAVALNRLESQSDIRALNAVGAPPKTARAIAGFSAAGLTIAAATVAVPAALLALTGVYQNPNEAFTFAMPVLELTTLFIVLPAVAALGTMVFTTLKTH